MKHLLRQLKDYKKETILAPLFKMLEALFDLFVPLVVARIINVGIGGNDRAYIIRQCLLLVALALIGLACSVTAQYFAARAATEGAAGLRRDLFGHIQKLDFQALDTIGTSTLITRITSDVNQVQNGINMTLRLLLRSPFIVFGAMIMAFTINFKAALIFVVTIPVLSVIVFSIMRVTGPGYRNIQKRLDRIMGVTRENLTGVRVVRAFGKEQDEIARFEEANSSLNTMQTRIGQISALMNPLTYVVVNLGIIAILYVGAREVDGGTLLSGDVVALINYMSQILVELVKMANTIVLISKSLASLNRINEILDTEPTMKFEDADRAFSDSTEAVRFDHVSLTYAGAGDESSCRKPSSLRARSARTFCGRTEMPPMRNSGKPLKSRRRRKSSAARQADSTSRSSREAAISPEASVSVSPSRGLLSEIRKSSFWTTASAHSTLRRTPL